MIRSRAEHEEQVERLRFAGAPQPLEEMDGRRVVASIRPKTAGSIAKSRPRQIFPVIHVHENAVSWSVHGNLLSVLRVLLQLLDQLNLRAGDDLLADEGMVRLVLLLQRAGEMLS